MQVLEDSCPCNAATPQHHTSKCENMTASAPGLISGRRSNQGYFTLTRLAVMTFLRVATMSDADINLLQQRSWSSCVLSLTNTECI
jgi:hypothetical protein